MAINMQAFLNSRLSIALGLILSRVPTPVGFQIAYWLGGLLAARKNNIMVRALRANLWVVHDERPTAPELDSLVRQTYRSAARSLYEFWHFIHNNQAVFDMVQFEESFSSAVEQARREKRGTLMVLPHLSNFDLVGRSAVLHGVHLHVLSYPRPPGGYRWQNALRQLPGLTITPMSVEALRQASSTLRSGGVVVTGIDRPLPGKENKYSVRFFDRPASLPVFHIRLALKHDLPIIVVGGRRKPDGNYSVWASPPIPMKRSPDLFMEIVQNAETVLDVLSGFVRSAPDQWAMFYPVWPEALGQMPT